MCTAITMKTKDHYFGRTLDIDCSYGEEVCIMPRKVPLCFREVKDISEHYAIIGMATVVEGTPLFYDAANEHGLCMAGLNFPGNAYYFPLKENKDNIAPFEFIPWILGQCKTLNEAKTLLARISIANISYSDKLPNSPLHWMISDAKGSIVVESRKNGLYIHDNPIGVLTNNPPFEYHLENFKAYDYLRTDNSEVVRKDDSEYSAYCQGLGAVGLPGDVSSMSRFVRVAFGLENSICEEEELSSVGQFFHLLSTVEMVKGVCVTDKGHYDITSYTSCMNADKGLYYYTTYNNHQITCVNMHGANLDGADISRFPIILKENILYAN